MTAAVDLLREVAAHGGRLIVPEPGCLRLVSASAVDPGLVERLTAAKGALLDLLASRCSRCLELEAAGVSVLLCRRCGHGVEVADRYRRGSA